MAILTVGGVALVAHAAGGVILSNAGGYIAGTYVGAPIVAAFTTAAGVLAQMGAATAAVATAPATVPILATVATVAVVAAGAYCYLHGLPVPVSETLSAAGLGSASAKGFMIPVAKLAPALILLGTLGILAYALYRDYKAFAAEVREKAGGRSTRQPEAKAVASPEVHAFAYRSNGKRRPKWLAWLWGKLFSFLSRKRNPNVTPARQIADQS